MIKRSKKYFWIMTFLYPLYFFVSSCVNNPKDIPFSDKKLTSVEEGKQIEGYYSADAKVKSKLTAPYMLRHITDSTYIEFPKSLHVDFYNDTMKIESVLDAHYGKYREFEQKVFLRDSVVVRNILKGDTLHCDELWWDRNTQKFYTDKKVCASIPKTKFFTALGWKPRKISVGMLLSKGSGF